MDTTFFTALCIFEVESPPIGQINFPVAFTAACYTSATKLPAMRRKFLDPRAPGFGKNGPGPTTNGLRAQGRGPVDEGLGDQDSGPGPKGPAQPFCGPCGLRAGFGGMLGHIHVTA